MNTCPILLSVLIPVYNAEKFIGRCIESIVTQPLFDSRHLEIIIINDGSTDDSQKIISNYSEKYGNIHIIERENRGIGPTRNELIEQCCGNYFWFVDADDYVDSDALNEILPLLYLNQYDMLMMGYYWGTENEGKVIHCAGEYSTALEMTQEGVFNNSLWTRIYRTQIIRERNIHFHSYQMGEDFDVIFKLIPFVGRCRCIDKPLYKYVTNPNSAVMNSSKEHVYKSSNDSLLCMEDNYEWIRQFDTNTQEILRKPLNFFLMGYLYSVYVVPFSMRYKFQAMRRLVKMSALPIRPLPAKKTHCLFSRIISVPWIRYISIWADVAILKMKGQVL